VRVTRFGLCFNLCKPLSQPVSEIFHKLFLRRDSFSNYYLPRYGF